MKISLSWLRDYLKTTQTAEQLAETLTRSGIEVKNILTHGAVIPKVVAAQILSSVQHPDADRLSVCKVDDGSGVPRQIVCGAKNYKEGDKILLALPGAVLPGGIKIKVGKLRGVESEGMMCSTKELGLGEGVDGLHILPSETILGTELNALFPSDEVFELEITPNRPDWLGHYGVAREAAVFGAGTFIEAPIILPVFRKDPAHVAIEAPEACFFYGLRRIEGITVGESPAWLRQRLEVLGLRPINNIVDVTNYVMFERAQPLHAFDAAKIQGALTVRFARQGESLLALNGENYLLTSDDLVIADECGPQALAGIIGGMASKVTKTTTAVLLESAAFNPVVIRARARTLGITTDAAYRLERGSHAAMAMEVSARGAFLMTELAGGKAAEELMMAGSVPEPRVVALRNDRCRQLLGVDMSDDTISSLLKKLGLTQYCENVSANDEKQNNLEDKQVAVQDQLLSDSEKVNYELRTTNYELTLWSAGRSVAWQIPSWRYDLTREVDLIEEVARLYGIETMPSLCVSLPAPSSQADRDYDGMMALRRRLASQSFYEARTSALVAPDLESVVAPITLRNPMGEQQSVLRGSLLPGLLAALKHNLFQGAASVRLFELGKVFQASSDAQEEESLSLGVVMTGALSSPNWRGDQQRSLDLYDLKGALGHLAPGKMSYRSIDQNSLSKNALLLPLEILCDGKVCGTLGLLAPGQARELMVTGQELPVAVATVNITLFQKIMKDVSWKKGGELSKFPSIKRDLALIVDQQVNYEALEKNLGILGEKHLVSMIPFDVFSDPAGRKVPLGKKSIALSLTFQDHDRTLTAEEVSQALERIVKQLQESVGVEMRC